MRLVPVLLLVLSTAASAQTSTIALKISDFADVTVAPTRCGSDLPVNWKYTGTTPCEAMKIWITSRASCSDSPALDDLTLTPVTQTEIAAGEGIRSFRVSSLPFDNADGGAGCGALGFEKTFRACASTRLPQGVGCATTFITAGAPPTLTYDSLPPAAPGISEVVPFDNALVVQVDVPDDADKIHLQVKQEADPDDAYVEGDSFGADVGQGKLTGLTNGISYSVRAQAEDGAGNLSTLSAVATGTPVNSAGFFEVYQGAGGQEEGGCAAVGGSVAPWLGAGLIAALGMILVRRRR